MEDFRIVETFKSWHNGRQYTVRVCEEFIGGKWEGFVSMTPVKPAAK